MEKPDIRKIAMFLAGRLPPYYGDSNVYAFGNTLNVFAKQKYTREEIQYVQSLSKGNDEEFYFMILDDLWKSLDKFTDETSKKKKNISDFVTLCGELGVGEKILGIEVANETKVNSLYTRSDYEQFLKRRYGENPTNNDKGELFEELCRDILLKDGFINTKIASRGEDGGIDITADKEILIGQNTKKFVSFFGQCKYKTNGSVTKDEVNALLTPIINDTNNMYQGILFLTNKGYQSNAKKILDNTQSSRTNIKSFYLDGGELLDILNKYPDLILKYST